MKTADSGPAPPCSVIVPTHNRVGSVLRLLDSLSRQEMPAGDFEVIVVDDGSTDSTWKALVDLETPYALRILRQRNQGPAVARNAAIREAKGETIVFLDDDVVAAPDLLSRHLDAQAETLGGCVAIGVMAMDEGRRVSPWVDWELRSLRRQYDRMLNHEYEPTPRQFYTANASAPRRALMDAGLFDPFFRRSEDIELAHRLMKHGLRFRFLSDAIIHHDPQRPFSAWKRMVRAFGYYDVIMWRKEGDDYLQRRVRYEYSVRKRPVQLLARLLAGRRRLVWTFITSAALAARFAAAVRPGRLDRIGFSAVYNVLYWQGVCEAMGSRRELLASVGITHQTVKEARPLPDGGHLE
jgi:glycosyltransferase involved in cell wall biosynthesis